MEALNVVILECPCGHRWPPRIPNPVECPKCRKPIVRWPKAMQPSASNTQA